MEIVTDYDKLSERCDEIDVRKENAEMRDIILALKNEIREKDLKGLAANQLGYNKRIFCIRFNKNIQSYINPIITNVKGFELSRESCPSIPGKEFIRTRHNEVQLVFQDPLGKAKSQKLLGLAAKEAQHLLDLLDGLLISDVGFEIDEQWDAATPEEREEVINAYLDSLDIAHSVAEKAIKEDKELKQMDDAAKFIRGIQTGEVDLTIERGVRNDA